MPRRFRIANLEQPPLRVARDRHDRVNDEVDDAAAAVDRQADGIDEERHVVVDDLDDRVRRRPAICQRVGVVNANLRLARAAAARQSATTKVPRRRGRRGLRPTMSPGGTCS